MSHSPLPGQGKTVLILDDDRVIRKLVEAALTPYGYRIRFAGDIAGGKRVVMDEPPELVLLDLDLPDGSGLEFCRILRSLGFEGLVVAISSYGQLKTRASAFVAGVDDFIQKPIEPAALFEQVKQAFEFESKLAAARAEPPKAGSEGDEKVAPTLLSIEDDPVFGAIIEKALTGRFEIKSVRDGFNGIYAAVVDPPDAIMLDIDLPILSGLHILRHLNAKEELKKIPVAVVSGTALSPEERAEIEGFPSVRVFVEKTGKPIDALQAAFELLI